MMEPDKISVIVPFRNVKPYILDCLKSIQNQTYSNFEVILLDDDSNDGSEFIAEAFAKEDNRFFYVKLSKQKSISALRNLGIAKATGKYLCWIDSDDFVSKDFLKILYDNITSGNFQMSTCSYKKSKNRNIKLDVYKKSINKKEYDASEVQKLCLSSNKIGGFLTIKMFITEIAKKILFQENLKASEDLVYVIQYLDLCEKICTCQSKLYFYFIRKGSISHSYQLNKMLNFVKAMNYLLAISKNKEYYENVICWRAMMTCMPIFLSHKDMKKKSTKRLKMLFAIYFDMAHKTIKENKKKKFSFYVKFVIWIMCIYYSRYMKSAKRLISN